MMMKCYSKEGKIDEAIQLFSEMIERGCDPDVVSINSLIDTLYKADQVDEAWAMFCKMKEMKLPPTVVTFNSLLASLGREGKVQEAVELFESITTQGCHPIQLPSIHFSIAFVRMMRLIWP